MIFIFNQILEQLNLDSRLLYISAFSFKVLIEIVEEIKDFILSSLFEECLNENLY